MRASPRFSSVFSTQFLLKYWALSTLPAGYIKLNKHKSSTCSTRIEKAPAAESELPPVSWTTKLKSKKQEAFHV